LLSLRCSTHCSATPMVGCRASIIIGQPTRQDLQTWKSGENVSTLNQKDESFQSLRCLSSCKLCRLLLSRRPSADLPKLLGEHPQIRAKIKAGVASAPLFPAARRIRMGRRRGPLPPPYGRTRQGAEKRGGPLPPIFRSPRENVKTEEGLCPPF
jgi:hypothetical protein